MKFKIFNHVAKREKDGVEVEKSISVDLGKETPRFTILGLLFFDPIITPTIISVGLLSDYLRGNSPMIETQEKTIKNPPDKKVLPMKRKK